MHHCTVSVQIVPETRVFLVDFAAEINEEQKYQLNPCHVLSSQRSYAMPGTDLAHRAVISGQVQRPLSAYAMSGTDIACATRCPALTYAMCGTELAYDALCSAMSGTDLAYRHIALLRDVRY
eukprot:23011-Rhodomonas_salina.1